VNVAGYRAEHVPGAVFADVPNALSDPGARFPFALPTPERFAAAAGGLGIGDDTHVVAYDTATGAWATRVWWLNYPQLIHTHNYEVCLLQALRDKVRSKEIWVVGANRYQNYVEYTKGPKSGFVHPPQRTGSPLHAQQCHVLSRIQL